MRAVIAVLLAIAPIAAHAHAEWRWTEPGQQAILVLMLVAGLLYGRGLTLLWRAAGTGRGVSRAAAASYAIGWLALGVALLSPLDGAGETLFAAHMLQHEVLMLVAAPLMVLGRPLATWSWAFAPGARTRITRALQSASWKRVWSALTRPLTAWCLHAAAIWGWHAPALFNAARSDAAIHALQHASFLFSALLFWWSLLRPQSRGVRAGGALLYLFTTMIHTGALGALFVFSDTVWYPANSAAGAHWGLTPLEDEQLGGLIMWIPGGFVYLAVALALFARMLATSRREELYA